MGPHLFRCLLWSLLAALSPALTPLPTEDDWYQPTLGWEKTAPGSVLRTRASPFFEIPVKNCSDTLQILFRSTDSYGNPSWSITTVFVPENPKVCAASDDSCKQGLVTYHVPADTINPNAAPSYLIQYGEPYGDIALSLARGWYVSLPDYEGPLAAFTAGRVAAHMTLDSVRAVLAVGERIGLRKDARIAFWGYSAGAQASGIAAEMAAEYAPELRIAGAIVGGPAPIMLNAFPFLNERKTTGLIIASLIGTTIQNPPAFKSLMASVKTEGPFNATGFVMGYTMTGLQALFYFWGQDVIDYFKNGRDDVWNPTIMELYAKDGMMGIHGVPSMPVFVYKALKDEFSDGKDSDDLVATYCKAGANVLYHRNEIGDHNGELTNGRQRALNFLGYVLDGNTTAISVPKTGCLTVDLSEKVDPATIA